VQPIDLTGSDPSIMQELVKLLALDALASRDGVALKPEIADAIRALVAPPPLGAVALPVRTASAGPARQHVDPDRLAALNIPTLAEARARRLRPDDAKKTSA